MTKVHESCDNIHNKQHQGYSTVYFIHNYNTNYQLTYRYNTFDALVDYNVNQVLYSYLSSLEAEMNNLHKKHYLPDNNIFLSSKILKDAHKYVMHDCVQDLDNLIDGKIDACTKQVLLKTLNRLKQVTALIISNQNKEIQILNQVIQNLPGSIYWKDTNGVYLGLNKFSAEKMCAFGFLEQEIIGKTDYDVFEKNIAAHYRKHDLEVMITGKPVVCEEVLNLTSGQKMVQLSSKKPLYDQNNKLIGIVANTVDVTHLKIIEEDLRQAKESAELANQIKTEFMRDMEHDIRTPFSGIYNISQYLLENESVATKKELLGHLVNASRELLDYFNTVLDFSRIESGRLNLVERKGCDLRKVISSVMNIEKPAAKFKNLALSYEIADNCPKIVLSDQYRLQRILINLVSNAIKFTESGFVRLTIKLSAHDDTRAFISFIVEDSGLGISLEQQDIICEKKNIHGVDKQILNTKFNGLGLKAVKHFVTELEGTFELCSALGKGTTFICTIPFQCP